MRFIKGIITFWVISELFKALKTSFHEHMDYAWSKGYDEGMGWQEVGKEYPPCMLDEEAA